METERDVYTVEPGRTIYRNGEPLLYIGIRGYFDCRPSEADDLIEVLQRFVREGVSEDAEIRLLTLSDEYGIGFIEVRPDGKEIVLHTDEHDD